MSEALRDYFRRLDRHLACPRSLRRRLTAQVRRGAEDYLRERPEADPAEVARYLGDPAETARELLENLDPEELRQARRRERLARRALVAVLVLVAALVLRLFVFRRSRRYRAGAGAARRRGNYRGTRR